MADLEELRKFVEWIPRISPAEAYLLYLMIRTRSTKEELGLRISDCVLERKAVYGYHHHFDPVHGWEYWRTRLYYHVLRFGVLASHGPWEYARRRPGTAEIESVVRIPPQVMAIYVQLNPSKVMQAVADAVRDAVSGLASLASTSEPNGELMRSMFRRPDLSYYSSLARRRTTIFHTVDADSKEVVSILENEFLEAIGRVPGRVVTRRGKHFLVDIRYLTANNLIRKWAGPPPPRVVNALKEYESKHAVCQERPNLCAGVREVLENALRDSNVPLMWKVRVLGTLYRDERGVPLAELKKQALEPVPGTLYKGVVVRFQFPER